MRLYVALAENVDWNRHPEVREQHFAYLAQLQETGSLIAAGLLGSSAGLFVYSAATAEEAEQLAANDPYCRSGVRTVRVMEWKLTRLLRWRMSAAEWDRLATPAPVSAKSGNKGGER